MADPLPEKIQQTRESIQRAVAQIEACFVSSDAVTDQFERACDLMLDFTKQFGVDQNHRREAILQKSSVVDLLTRERIGELSRADFRTETTQLRRHVLELTAAMAEAAERHLANVDASRDLAASDSARSPVDANPPQSNLRDSLEAFLKEKSGDGVVFRCKGMSKRY